MKLGKISLLQLSKAEMERREQNMLRGGNICMCECVGRCPCKYAGPQEGPDDSYYGGSSTEDNRTANGEKLFAKTFENGYDSNDYCYGEYYPQ